MTAFAYRDADCPAVAFHELNHGLVGRMRPRTRIRDRQIFDWVVNHD